MRKTLPGFSLFETVLYLALFSLLAIALFRFSWDVFDLHTKNQVLDAVFSDARLVTSRIDMLIRNASGINGAASRFDTADGKLVLEQLGSGNTVTIDIQNGNVVLTESGQPGTVLNSPKSKVVGLTFSKHGTQVDGSEYVSFSLSLGSGVSSVVPADFSENTTIEGGDFIRNSGL